MFKLKIDPKSVVFGFIASLYLDSVSDGSHFCESGYLAVIQDGWQHVEVED